MGMSYAFICLFVWGWWAYDLHCSLALIWMSVIRKVTNTPTEHVLSILFCLSLSMKLEPQRAPNKLFEDGLRLAITVFGVCVFRQYTNMSARVCVILRMLLASSHYFCFIVFFFLFFFASIIMKKMICDTFTLFSSFLDGESKNSKRKSSASFLVQV